MLSTNKCIISLQLIFADTLKRKLEDDVSAKRAKLDLDRLNLENLPDDVLYVILSFLDATSYYNLGL